MLGAKRCGGEGGVLKEGNERGGGAPRLDQSFRDRQERRATAARAFIHDQKLCGSVVSNPAALFRREFSNSGVGMARRAHSDSRNGSASCLQRSGSHCAESRSNAADSDYRARYRLSRNAGGESRKVQRMQSIVTEPLGRRDED